MQVRILGPLQVMCGTADATPTAPKLRRILALFAVHAGSEVRTDQIIDELWEDRPPSSAMTTLQTYVYQLRKLLQLGPEADADDGARAGMPTLRTSPGGYQLALPSSALDCREFEQLAGRGREHLDAGRLTEAAETLRVALRLWRGPALSDVGVGPVLQASAVRLEELRKSALEHRIEAELALGCHQELISELTGIVSEQPTHEGFQAKLMLALYRSGRRSDALRVYQRARAALADQLGLEPSAELERLHRAVLVADTALDAPTGDQAHRRAARTMPPRQLPADSAPIVGRDEQLAHIRRILHAPSPSVPPVVAVCGIPGSGKSALAVHAAHAVGSDYPDGHLFAELVDAGGVPIETGHVLGHWLRAAGVPDEHVPDSLEERTRLFRSWTADRGILVVVDDVTSVGQLRPLLPTGPRCAALVACRRRLSGPSITSTLVLDPLGEPDAEAMLTALLDSRRVADDLAAVRELVEICAGSPLALRAAATTLCLRPHWPIRRLLTRLRPDRTDSPFEVSEMGLTASVGRTDRLLPPDARVLFRVITARTERQLTASTVARVMDISPAHAEALLEELVEFQLVEVERQVTGSEDLFAYRVHPLVGACAEYLDDIEGTRAQRCSARTAE